MPFRDWLQAEDAAGDDRVTRILSRLDDAFANLRRAGLTPTEVEASRRFVMARLAAVPSEPTDEVAANTHAAPSSS
jgi:hypothetical protein